MLQIVSQFLIHKNDYLLFDLLWHMKNVATWKYEKTLRFRGKKKLA